MDVRCQKTDSESKLNNFFMTISGRICKISYVKFLEDDARSFKKILETLIKMNFFDI